jgi:serine protease AprX
MRARISVIVVAALSLALLLAAPAWADDPSPGVNPSVEQVLETVDPGTAVPVIVYAPGHTGDLQGDLPIPNATTDLSLVDGVAVDLTAAQIDQIAALPYVSQIVADNMVFGADYQSSMDITNLTIGLGALTPPANGGLTGDNVTVAVIDSGIQDHSDLSTDGRHSRLIGWKDFVNGRKRPYDDAGHGTFVAGLIAGDGSASLPADQGGWATTQFRGVAPGANIVALKVLDKYGQCRSSDVVAAIAWAIHHKRQYNIRVLNISVGGNVGGPTYMDPMAMAVEAAWKAGIVVVSAAGNEGEFGPGGIVSPGNDPYVITVGALNTQQTADRSDDAVASYSSVGPTLFDEFAKPDLVAPGNRLISDRAARSYIDRTWPDNRIAVNTYDPNAPAWAQPDYFMLSGTSAAAPVVAGAIALMIQQDPSLKPDDIKLRLMHSADPVAGASAGQEGAGVVDVPGALAATDKATGPALSADLGNGTTVLDPGTYAEWQKYAWTKYAWTKYAWTKYAWTKYAWTKYAWTKYAWTKYAWTKYAWTKYAWTVAIDGE